MTVVGRRHVAMFAAVAAALAGSSLAPASAAPHLRPGPPRARAAAAGSGWPQFGFSAARTSDNLGETTLGPGNVAGLQQKWSFFAGERVESSPAVVAGVVYFSSQVSHLYAVRAATGAQLWSFGVTNAFFSAPAVADGVVYTGSVNGRLYALNAATGKLLWSFATPGQVFTPPAVTGGTVYFESDFGLGGAVYALDAATGTKLWSVATSGRPQDSVAVANGVVYAVTANNSGLGGSAYALSAASGKILWHVRNPGTALSPGTLFTPMVANGILYVGVGNGTTQAQLEALRASTGRLLWQSPVIGLDQSSPAIAGGLVYIGDDSGFVRAFNATTGAQAWQFATPHGVEATPVVANGVVYDSASEVSGTLYALNATTGHKLASFPLGTATIAPAVVAGGTVYIGGYDQRLHAFALP